MTGDKSPVLAGSEGDELLHHLMADYVMKAGIVLVALMVLAVGMAVVWRRVGRGPGDRNREPARIPDP